MKLWGDHVQRPVDTTVSSPGVNRSTSMALDALPDTQERGVSAR